MHGKMISSPCALHPGINSSLPLSQTHLGGPSSPAWINLMSYAVTFAGAHIPAAASVPAAASAPAAAKVPGTATPASVIAAAPVPAAASVPDAAHGPATAALASVLAAAPVPAAASVPASTLPNLKLSTDVYLMSDVSQEVLSCKRTDFTDKPDDEEFLVPVFSVSSGKSLDGREDIFTYTISNAAMFNAAMSQVNQPFYIT